MSAKLHSVWPILALDGVGDAIGDARPIFVVSRDGRFLHFANAGGARFLGLAPAAALDTRITLEPRLAERLARFAAGAAPGATARELVRYFGGLRSSLLSVGFRRLADDAVLVGVDNAPITPADADPAASLAAIAAEGGLVALFDGAGDVVAAQGDHAALDDVQDDIATALDTEDGEAVFTRRVVTAGRAHDLALVRLGDAEHPRRLLHVGPAVALATMPVTIAEPEAPATPPEASTLPVAAPAPAATEEAAAPIAAASPAEPAVNAETEARNDVAADAPPMPLEDLAAAAPSPAEPVAATTLPPLVAPLIDDDAEPAEAPVAAAALAAMAPVETIYALPPVSPLDLEADEIRIEAPDRGEAERLATTTEVSPRTDGASDVTSQLADLAPAEPLTVVEAEPPKAAADVAATLPAAGAPTEPLPVLAAAVDAITEATPQVASAPGDEPSAGFRYRPAARAVKFVWQMDAERRFTLVSDELAEVVGPVAADVVGLSWREVAERFQLDPEGRVGGALERRDTWSGRTVLWPVEGEALRLPVDLAALPAFDRGRIFTGYRGFGTIRGEEAIPDPTGTGLRLPTRTTQDDTAPTEPTEPEPAALLVATPAETPAALTTAIAPLAAGPVTASTSAEPLAETRPDDLPPPDYPDDSEVALVEAHHPRPVEPTADGGEAAFAGEIEPAATADDDVDFDDELALAMATLPACGEGRPVATTPAEADETGAVPTSSDTALPPSEAATSPVDTILEAVEPRLAPAPYLGPETVASPAALAAMAPIETIYALPPASPLELEADDLRLAPAPHVDTAPSPGPAEGPPPSRVDRLAEAPAALRAAVAEIAERAAELEPRIVLPQRAAAEETATESADALVAPTIDPSPASEPIAVAEPAAPIEPAVETAPTRMAAPAVAIDPTPPAAAALPAETSAPLAALPVEAPTPLADTASNIVALAASTRLPAEAVRLSPPERVAFRQIAEALGARIEGEDLPPMTAPEARPSAAGGAPGPYAPSTSAAVDTRLLDRLPGAVAVVKDDDLVYGNDAFLRLLGYPDLATLAAEGGLDALFAGEHVAKRWRAAPDGTRPVPVLARDGRVVPVDATVATVPWAGGSALMLTLAEVQATPSTEPAEAIVPAAEIAAAPADASTPTPATSAAPPAPLTASLSDDFADTALRDRLGELEAIIDTATDGVLMLDGEGIILSANHTAEALFGTDRHAMVGRSLADRLAPESRRSAMDYLDGLARNGVASVLNDGREVIGVVEQGGLIPLFMTIGRISTAPVRKYCAVLRDITQWKKSEEELTAARRRAEEASVHKSDFLAKISHEIRTPLNAIIGFSEVMMDERFGPVGNERYKDYLRDIHSSGSHIMSLINDLLDLSKVEAGKMDLRFEAVTLADIVSECVAMMQPQANRERIIIRSSLPAGVPPVVADPRSVRQVVLNLLSNAIKFTPSGGQVIVSTTLEDSGEVVLRVRDTGYGMTDKELQTAMEPFRQLHTTRSRGGGTGLGLPLTKALVEANRAVFRIDSTVGQGTLVTVTFPVTRVLAS